MSHIVSIEDFILEVLEHRFEDEREKIKILPEVKGYNFSCPYCGDSRKRASKHRGHIYMGTKSYKCWNDGCLQYATLREFVSKWTAEYDIDISDLDIDFDVDFDVTTRISIPKGTNIFDYIVSSGLMNSLIDMQYLIDRFSLYPISMAAEGSMARNFAESRMLYDIPEHDDYMYCDNQDSKVYIFNMHKESGKVISYAVRNLEERIALVKKYDMFNYSRMIDKMGIETPPDLQFIDTLGNYFNIMNVNRRTEISITEGQIDSMFAYNGIAASGTGKLAFILKYVNISEVRILFDSDKAGVKESITALRDGFKVFMWRNLFGKLYKKFREDRLKIMDIKDPNELYCYLKNKYGVINYDMFNSLLDKYYTNNFLDILSL
jgi:predicted RNA-binding Zn-ribbon protein involved in translation (DUF1610 family)